LSVDVVPVHSHEASWSLALGASPAHRRIGAALLPLLQRIKGQLVVLGTAYFTDLRDDAFERASKRIADTADEAVSLLRDRNRFDQTDVLVQRLCREFSIMAVTVQQLSASSVSPLLIAELRRAYGAIRDLGAALWEFEYIFEGNATSHGGSDV
jgi:hypothetical protein